MTAAFIIVGLALVWATYDDARDQRQLRTTAWLGTSLDLEHHDRRISIQDQIAPPSPGDEVTAAEQAELANERCNDKIYSRGDAIQNGDLIKGVIKLEVGGEPVCIAANGIYVMDGTRVEIDSFGGQRLSGSEYLNQISVSNEPDWFGLMVPVLAGAFLGAGLGGFYSMTTSTQNEAA